MKLLSKNQKFVFTVGFFLFVNSILGIEPVVLSEDRGEYPLGLYLEILEDKEGKLTIDDVQKPEMEKSWVRSKVEVPSFGFSKSVYWVKFKILSHSKKEFYLEIAHPILDRIDFYSLANNNNIVHKKTGDMLPFIERDIQYRNFIFILPFDDNLEKDYFIRFESESSMQFPMTIWSSLSFVEKKNNVMLGMGLYFGVMLVMALYNLFIWLSIRDKSYLYYVSYIFFISLFMSNYYGFTYQYFWVGSPYLYNAFFPIVILIVNLTIIVFTTNFLQIKKNIPRFYSIYKIQFIILIVCTFLSPFLSNRLSTSIGVSLAIFSFSFCLIVGLLSLKKNYRPARYYMLAWSVFLIGAILLPLKSAGLVPANFITQHSIQFGSALEVILLSLGLADRINDLKKQNEIEQARTIEAERKSNKIKDEFLANLSHELKTPLSVVFSYSEMLSTGNDYPEKVKKYSGRIYESAQKLNDYVSDLILIVDIESNLQLQKANINLPKLIENVIIQYKPLIEEKEIQLENIEIAQDNSALSDMNCDPILLQRAISAILKNSIVYNKQGGKIKIGVIVHGSNSFNENTNVRNKYLQLTFSDTGIGIKKEFHEKIFEKFFRVDSTLTYEVSGVGVGLFIAKKIIELHGGNILVKSELEKGSEITFNIPLPDEK